MHPLPEKFLNYAFRQRRDFLRRFLEGSISESEFLVAFTRHTPAIISCGRAGPNGSIKGIGFVQKMKFIEDTVKKAEEFLESVTGLPRGKAMRLALKFLLDEVYVEEKIDFTKLSSLELAKGHSWANLNENPRASILFYTPPSISFEVRAKVEVHERGAYWKYVNAIHDVFHAAGNEKRRDWSKTPAYIFLLEEIYDNSVEAMGRRIWSVSSDEEG
ncbi:MAG TPA: pyridoxamine 5'-phosphate oxidase family protein [Candidatus Korarchaeota archaeon]|nr:pyridoxamine 5'-phosphate oxidase family protein [Candidatus Korarchaeota archaeon]